MRLLSDSIEDFIKALMEDEQDQQQAIELRRNELAEHFQCAPSQINYVLATRFTPDHGYVIESRRGGGGYIRIMRLASTSREELLQSLYQRIGMSIRSADAMKIVDHLESEKVVAAEVASQADESRAFAAGGSAAADHEGRALRGNAAQHDPRFGQASPERLTRPGGQGGIPTSRLFPMY